MVTKMEHIATEEAHGLGADFGRRIESSLPAADRDRDRYLTYQRAARFLPLLLLVGPIIGWRLMVASPDAFHLAVSILVWITFVLDVGVHLDATVLSYLGLQALPSLVGGFLLILLTGRLLGSRTEE